MKTFSLLLVEDQSLDAQIYQDFCLRLGFHFHWIPSLGEFHSPQTQALLEDTVFDYALIDIYLSPKNPSGLEIIQNISQKYPFTTVIAMSSFWDKEIYEQSLKRGAHHFLRKPCLNLDEFSLALNSGLHQKQLQFLINQQKKDSLPISSFLLQQCPLGLVLDHQTHLKIQQSSEHHSIPVVIHGESGTGKEEIVKAIYHQRVSDRGSPIPFVSVNCANIQNDLLESQMFGHKKGSFSGAYESTVGFIGEAHGGILFLDEIQSLNLSCQQKLLRTLHDGSYQRLGDTKVLYSQFQIIVASNQTLDNLVFENKIMIDLRTRLTGIEIFLKPLRERLEEMPLFIALILEKKAIQLDPLKFSQLVKKCQTYYWMGNIRQLSMVIQLWLIISKNHHMDDFPLYPTMNHPKDTQQIKDTEKEDLPLKDVIENLEKEYIKKHMDKYQGNCSQVSRILQISRTTLDAKLQKYSFFKTVI